MKEVTFGKILEFYSFVKCNFLYEILILNGMTDNLNHTIKDHE